MAKALISDQKAKRGRRAGGNATTPSPVQVLDRSLKLLKVVAADNGATLSELASNTGMATSTVHRLLTSLANHGMVSHDPETGAWTVGAGAFVIGNGFLPFRKLGVIGRPFLQRLMEESGETANIGIIDDGDVVFIAQIECHAPMRAFYRVGRRGPIHASGIGKAIVSTWPDSRIRTMLADKTLAQFTERTLHTLPTLLRDINRIRSRGWAADDGEHTSGMRCLAAPIFDEYGEAIAGISISGPAARITQEKLSTLGPIVLKVADELTSAVGGRSGPP